MELRHIESDHHVLLHDASGMPSEVRVAAAGRSQAVAFTLELDVEVGGEERRGSTGGIEYTDTHHFTTVVVAGDPCVQETPAGRVCRVPISIRASGSASHPGDDAVTADLLYRFNRLGPGLSFAIDFVGTQRVLIRNLTVRGVIGLEPASWTVRAPGNAMASGVPLADIGAAVGVSPIEVPREVVDFGIRAVAIRDVEHREADLRFVDHGAAYPIRYHAR